ncbi:MAG TPA: hypothetical protein PKY51_01775 [Fimbriimonadaceae bacterium]|nr:hypothetical protein [Fimbriimonadaceae bacterium]
MGTNPSLASLRGLGKLDFARAIRHATVEYAAIFAGDQIRVGPYRGNTHGVFVPLKEESFGLEMIHNHPGQTSFSKNDLAWARDHRQKSISIVWAEGPMIRMSNGVSWLDDRQIHLLYDQSRDALILQAFEKCPATEPNRVQWIEHYVHQRLAAEMSRRSKLMSFPSIKVEEIEL